MTNAIESFRALHESGCFVIPNPWDVGSAKFLAHLGFRALATTSAGFGFARGVPDRVGALGVDDVLAHARELAAAVDVPITIDFQDGYASDLDGVATNVTRACATGAAGLSIEDATGDRATPLHDRATAIARVRAARAAIDASGTGALLTARCEAYLVGDPDPARTALDRLVAFADAGADCLFAPGARDPDTIASMVRAVAPRPLNVIVTGPTPGLTVARLRDLGVRRISVGSALARAAWGGFARAARLLAAGADDAFDGLAGALTFAELNDLFASP